MRYVAVCLASTILTLKRFKFSSVILQTAMAKVAKNDRLASFRALLSGPANPVCLAEHLGMSLVVHVTPGLAVTGACVRFSVAWTSPVCVASSHLLPSFAEAVQP